MDRFQATHDAQEANHTLPCSSPVRLEAATAEDFSQTASVRSKEEGRTSVSGPQPVEKNNWRLTIEFILSQNTLFPSSLFSSSFPLFQDPTMTTRPSRKAPSSSSLLSATKASSAHTRSSSRLKARTIMHGCDEDTSTRNATVNGNIANGGILPEMPIVVAGENGKVLSPTAHSDGKDTSAFPKTPAAPDKPVGGNNSSLMIFNSASGSNGDIGVATGTPPNTDGDGILVGNKVDTEVDTHVPSKPDADLVGPSKTIGIPGGSTTTLENSPHATDANFSKIPTFATVVKTLATVADPAKLSEMHPAIVATSALATDSTSSTHKSGKIVDAASASDGKVDPKGGHATTTDGTIWTGRGVVGGDKPTVSPKDIMCSLPPTKNPPTDADVSSPVAVAPNGNSKDSASSSKEDALTSPKNLYSIFASKTPSKSPTLTLLGKTRPTTKPHPARPSIDAIDSLAIVNPSVIGTCPANIMAPATGLTVTPSVTGGTPSAAPGTVRAKLAVVAGAVNGFPAADTKEAFDDFASERVKDTTGVTMMPTETSTELGGKCIVEGSPADVVPPIPTVNDGVTNLPPSVTFPSDRAGVGVKGSALDVGVEASTDTSLPAPASPPTEFGPPVAVVDSTVNRAGSATSDGEPRAPPIPTLGVPGAPGITRIGTGSSDALGNTDTRANTDNKSDIESTSVSSKSPPTENYDATLHGPEDPHTSNQPICSVNDELSGEALRHAFN